MHMSDTLISPAVGAAMCAVSLAANVYAVKRIKKDDIHKMGVMGAFVFATQMLNFTIPATGSSGHIMGGILLAAMLGQFPALLTISAVLITQCLFFADGGLLALGCNIFNIGVIPCLLVYPLIFKPLSEKNIALASIIAVVASLQLGAFSVVLETQLSGITSLPFSTFLFYMQPIHFAIGLAEGIATAAILCFAYQRKNALIAFALTAVLAAGVFAPFASSYPDGLEWAIEKTNSANPILPKSPSFLLRTDTASSATSFSPTTSK